MKQIFIKRIRRIKMDISNFNYEGYPDPTAHQALSLIQKKERAIKAYKQLTYICSPYAGNIDANVKAAKRYSRYAIEKGVIPIAPHLLFPQFLDDANPDGRQLGLAFGNKLMAKCEEVWVFGSDISEGMAAEIMKAKVKCKPIRYFTKDCEEVQK